jgi:hypothetical protein
MHGNLEHLLEFVCFIEEWQQEVENDEEADWGNFLPITTYEDAAWMCLGTCILAHQFCMPDVPFKIDLSWCGTNSCHWLNVANANQGCNIADNVNASAFNMKALETLSAPVPCFDGTALPNLLYQHL